MPFNIGLRDTTIRYWVIVRKNAEQVIAKERCCDPGKRTETIEGQLETIRIRLRSMSFINKIPFEGNPERIIEVWY